jgi:hypothetical protein
MDIRQQAKEAGIKSWHVKSEETLKAELDALVSDEKPVEPKPVVIVNSFERVQIQRGEEKKGVLKKDLYDYIRNGWTVIDAD